MRHIDKDDLEELTLGATLLGTGGGGDPFIAMLLVSRTVSSFQ